MAHSRQAKKRVRQNRDHREHNIAQRSMLRTYVKNVLKAILAGNKEQATTAYQLAVPVVDRMVNKKQIHANKAARHKSRLNARIKAMA